LTKLHDLALNRRRFLKRTALLGSLPILTPALSACEKSATPSPQPAKTASSRPANPAAKPAATKAAKAATTTPTPTAKKAAAPATKEAAAGQAATSKGDLVCTDVTGLTDGEKTLRTAFQYVEKSKNANKVCSDCMQFTSVPGGCGSCKVVKGPINPAGNCASWIKRS